MGPGVEWSQDIFPWSLTLTNIGHLNSPHHRVQSPESRGGAWMAYFRRPLGIPGPEKKAKAFHLSPGALRAPVSRVTGAVHGAGAGGLQDGCAPDSTPAPSRFTLCTVPLLIIWYLSPSFPSPKLLLGKSVRSQCSHPKVLLSKGMSLRVGCQGETIVPEQHILHSPQWHQFIIFKGSY